MEAAAVSTEGPEPVHGPGPGELVERVQELQARLDEAGDPPTRELAEELLSALVRMYGAGLERIVAALRAAGQEGQRLAAALSGDELVATLLLIHDLHPVPLEERVQGALDSVRPYMESHGGNVELLALEDGVARIHLRGSCSDCAASSVTLELAIKQALEAAAPDLEGLEVEGVAPPTTGMALPMADGGGQPSFELPVVMSPGAPAAPRSWFEVTMDEPADGTLAAVTVAGQPLVIAKVEGTLLAYRDACAGCGASLHAAELRAGALACPHCSRSFFLPRAGRSMDDERIQLEPVPLLREQGGVKVALFG
jgi:Fe-S cluster biogenesis protein NfuA/nitrite reductase/ring-hydroxylating ferredoxin subunit